MHRDTILQHRIAAKMLPFHAVNERLDALRLATCFEAGSDFQCASISLG